MELTEHVWRADYVRAHAAIPAEWIVTEQNDGWQGIGPDWADEPLVRHYQALQQVGYFRGWL